MACYFCLTFNPFLENKKPWGLRQTGNCKNDPKLQVVEAVKNVPYVDSIFIGLSVMKFW